MGNAEQPGEISSGLDRRRTVQYEAWAALRRTALTATSRLSGVSVQNVPGTVRKILTLIARGINATGVHLFQLKLDSEQTGVVRLKFNSGAAIDAAVLPTLNCFQFHLFSGPVQEALLSHKIATVNADTLGGGRIVSGLIKLTNCASYVLCPIRERGRLRGILGVACPQPVDDCGLGFYELLQLNGGMLLSHVLRTQREKSRRQKLRQWRRIANQACDFAIGLDQRLQICSITEFGAGKATPQLKGLRLVDVVTRNFHGEVQRQIGKAVAARRVRTCDFQISLGHERPRWYLARIEPSDRVDDVHVTLYLTDNNPDKVLQEGSAVANGSISEGVSTKLTWPDEHRVFSSIETTSAGNSDLLQHVAKTNCERGFC